MRERFASSALEQVLERAKGTANGGALVMKGQSSEGSGSHRGGKAHGQSRAGDEGQDRVVMAIIRVDSFGEQFGR